MKKRIGIYAVFFCLVFMGQSSFGMWGTISSFFGGESEAKEETQPKEKTKPVPKKPKSNFIKIYGDSSPNNLKKALDFDFDPKYAEYFELLEGEKDTRKECFQSYKRIQREMEHAITDTLIETNFPEKEYFDVMNDRLFKLMKKVVKMDMLKKGLTVTNDEVEKRYRDLLEKTVGDCSVVESGCPYSDYNSLMDVKANGNLREKAFLSYNGFRKFLIPFMNSEKIKDLDLQFSKKDLVKLSQESDRDLGYFFHFPVEREGRVFEPSVIIKYRDENEQRTQKSYVRMAAWKSLKMFSGHNSRIPLS